MAYQDGCPEATVPMILPTPEYVENTEDEHQYTEHYEQPPGARCFVIDLHFLDHDHFRSHSGDPGGALVSGRCVNSTSDKRCRS